jgi:hypothetical protein
VFGSAEQDISSGWLYYVEMSHEGSRDGNIKVSCSLDMLPTTGCRLGRAVGDRHRGCAGLPNTTGSRDAGGKPACLSEVRGYGAKSRLHEMATGRSWIGSSTWWRRWDDN